MPLSKIVGCLICKCGTLRSYNVQDLPSEVLLFLLASRYCEVDSELKEIAWKLFSQTPFGWPRVQAICNFVHQHIRFDYMQARANRTAREIYYERVGVCRDYMHLAITFCRCMNIPARYCTGYLGDIGVPLQPYPMDFSAWFEAYLGGQWYTFDARNNTPRIGRVLMARGRDAADVALTTTFGMNTLQSFKVWTDEVGADALLGSLTAAVAFHIQLGCSFRFVDRLIRQPFWYHCTDVSPFCFSIEFAVVRAVML